MNVSKFLQSKKFTATLIAIAVLIALLGAFKAGMVVGYKKAGYSYRWGENYHRNFAGPRNGFFGDFKRVFRDKDFISGHGTFGSIVAVDTDPAGARPATLIIKSKGGVEKTVLVSHTTEIRDRNYDIKASDLKADDQVVIIGSPNEEGQIDAKIIRVFR